MNKLKNIYENQTILYIEKDLKKHEEVVVFLKNNFLDVYQASDGLDGIKQFIRKKPNVVLTDLELDKKNGIEMIADMKQIDSEVKIIVLSSKNEEYELLQNLDMGLVDLLLKPFEEKSLTESLHKMVPADYEKVDYKCIRDLENIFKTKEKINISNNYKGITIQNSTEIISLRKNNFIVNVPITQVIASKYEKHSIFYIEKINKYIFVSLKEIDIKKGTLLFTNPKYIPYKQRDNTTSRVTVDKSFKATAFVSKKHTEFEVLNISFNSASLQINSYLDIKVENSFDFTFGFDINGPSSMINEKKFTKIFAKGKVQRVEQTSTGLSIVILLDIQKSSQNMFRKYLKQREMEIIQELKKRMRG